MRIAMDKKYKTRDRRDVRILCVDRNSDQYPIVGLVENRDFFTFTSLGKPFILETGREVDHALDLIEVKEKKELWVNVYPDTGFTDKKDADNDALYDRIACIRVEYEEGEGL